MLKKLYYMLPQDERRETFLIAFLMIIGMILETLGVGLILPIITVLIEPELLENYPLIYNILGKINFLGEAKLLQFILLLLVLVFLFKNLYLFFLNYYKLNFSYRVNLYLATKLFNTYLKQTYTYFLDKNSSQLIRNINFEVNSTINVINMLMVIVSETLVSLSIIALLLYMQTFTAGSSLIFLIFIGFLIYYFTKNILTEFGKKRVIYDGARLKHLQQSFDTIKDLKIFGKEDIFQGYYKKANNESLKISWYQNVLKTIPAYLVEFTAVFLVSFILIFLIYYKESSPTEFIPVIALFAAAAFRMMPSANRIITSFQQIRFSMPSVNVVHKDLVELKKTINNNQISKSPIIFKKKLSLKNIHYKYPNSKKWILKDVDLEIPNGSFYGIVGTTGSGKSTLIDIITGLLSPVEGDVLADEVNINQNIKSWQSRIGYVSQSINLIDDSLVNNIAFGVNPKDIDYKSLDIAIKMSGLEDFVNTLPDGIKTFVGEKGVKISGGERQRIAIARALYINPSLIIFDEATSSLDNKTESEIISSIEELKGKITILMIAHRLSTLENCDRCFKVENGKITIEQN